MSYGVIYGLYDPLTEELRYIGQTQGTVMRRLSGHLSSARRNGHGRPRYVTNWVHSLLQKSLKPEIKILFFADSQEELNVLETRAIAEARASGVRLTNHDNGGLGAPGRKLTNEHKAKLHSPEVVARMAATRKGQPSPMKGRQHSVESLAKMSASKRGNQCRLRRDVSTDAILQRIREGASLPMIAIEMGAARHTILNRYRQAAQAGVPVPELNPTWFTHTEDTKQRIGRAQLGRARSEATKARISAAKTKISTALILHRLAEGVTVRQLAQEAGVDRSTIYTRLRKERGT